MGAITIDTEWDIQFLPWGDHASLHYFCTIISFYTHPLLNSRRRTHVSFHTLSSKKGRHKSGTPFLFGGLFGTKLELIFNDRSLC